jgi:hypothetical protein
LSIIVGKLSAHYFSVNLRPNHLYFLLSYIIFICIGFVLGLEHLYKQIKKRGKWHCNLPKLLLIGLPAFYVSLTNLIIFSYIDFLNNTIGAPLIYLFQSSGGGYVSLTQIIFGLTLITGFYRDSKELDTYQDSNFNSSL